MIRVHIVPATDETNGVWRVATLLAKEDGGRVVCPDCGLRGLKDAVSGVDEVWVHGMWLPREWAACLMALRGGKRLVRMTHGSLSPVYLAQQGKWKKRLAGIVERRLLRRADAVVATCEAEAEWIRAYEPRVKRVEVTDVKRFFNLPDEDGPAAPLPPVRSPLRALYLGRRHPLKGVDLLEEAAKGMRDVELRIETDVSGEAKERAFEWCDVVVAPTLSENFGLVIAEALERGKRVVATDGAPAWAPREGAAAYGGRLVYLEGYVAGTRPERVAALNGALKAILR